MFRIAIALLALAVAGAALGKPDRKDQTPKEPKVKPLPNLERYTQWGWLRQQGRILRIDGGREGWTATGEIRADGKVRLLWLRSDGRYANGLYEVHDGKINGKWGYVDETALEADGTLSGATNGEEIREVEPPAPDA